MAKDFQGHDSQISQNTGRPTPETVRWGKSVDKDLRDQAAELATKAPLASPTLTGDPKAPTAPPGDNDTSIATTAFVAEAVAAANVAVLQVLQDTYDTNADLTAQMLINDAVPTSGQGTEVLSQAITPASASNNVLVEVAVWGSTSTSSGDIVVAVFRGSTCIQAVQSRCTTADFPMSIAVPSVLDSPATTSPTTYSVRVGPRGTITVRLNGSTGGRQFGGVAKCTLTLSEIKG